MRSRFVILPPVNIVQSHLSSKDAKITIRLHAQLSAIQAQLRSNAALQSTPATSNMRAFRFALVFGICISSLSALERKSKANS
jgi:hypothetical protein